MNRTAWKCFNAYVPLSYKVLMITGTLLCAAFNFLMTSFFGILGTVIGASFMMLIIIFLDYIPFSGISVRHQKHMEIFKSSFYGTDILKKVLKTDTLVKGISALVIFVIGLCGGGLSEGIGGFVTVLLYYLVFLAITGFFMILTRRKGLSMLAQFLFCYLASNASGLVFVLIMGSQELSMHIFKENKTVLLIIELVFIVVFAILTVVAARLLYKDSVTGYESGFSDSVEVGRKNKKEIAEG